MSNVIKFKANGDEHILEIIDDTGEKWIPSQQVGEALGHSNIRKLIRDLNNAGELTAGIHYCNLTLHQVGDIQRREILALSYRGIIRISMRAETQRAIVFRDWAEDVLYEVMTTGNYTPAAMDEDGLLHLLYVARRTERLARIFGPAKIVYVRAGLKQIQAAIKANDYCREKTGIDVFEEFGISFLADNTAVTFIQEECLVGPQHSVHPPTLYRAYINWCEKAGSREISGKQYFYEQLYLNFEIARIRTGTKDFFRGICPKAIWDEEYLSEDEITESHTT